MDFKRTNWKNNDPSTPLSAANMNKIEDAIEGLIDEIDFSRAKEEALATSLAHLNENMILDTEVNDTSIKGVQNKAIKQYIDNKIKVVVNDDNTIDLIIN